MRATLIILLLACGAAAAQPQRPNQVVWQGEDWGVVRSVREQGSVVACTGFYRSNPMVQLSKDTLILKFPKQAQVHAVAVGLDRGEMAAPRPLTGPEQQLGAIVFEGASFDALGKARMLRLGMQGEKGVRMIRLDLRGLPKALDVIRDCPAK